MTAVWPSLLQVELLDVDFKKLVHEKYHDVINECLRPDGEAMRGKLVPVCRVPACPWLPLAMFK